jgi:hypothetical protein
MSLRDHEETESSCFEENHSNQHKKNTEEMEVGEEDRRIFQQQTKTEGNESRE